MALKCPNKDIAAEKPQRIRLTIRGAYKPVLFDTIRGGIEPMAYRIENGNTVIDTTIYDYDSLLIQLTETAEQGLDIPEEPREKIFETVLRGKVPYTRAEPNALLMDTAMYSLDGEPFRDEEEILRLDNVCREKLGWPSRASSVAQPWVIEQEAVTHALTLRFRINSQIPVSGAQLAH